ncbi:MAG: hypothetical protein GY866_43330 [Proteobacteria bacterium]|nr:hypothetical protein [Pseudomonadota bacterium]
MAAEKSVWKWTQAYPKPDWFSWGDDFSKEKPARGGIYRTAAPRYIGLMNPNHWPVNDWVAMTYIYEFLLRNDGKYQSNINYLSESWEYTGPRSAVMKLKRGDSAPRGRPSSSRRSIRR